MTIADMIVCLGKRTRSRYFCHVGAMSARSLSPAISSGGRFAQASNASRSLAGDGDDPPFEGVGLGRVEGLAPDKIAKVRAFP
jgi:hypothetical protein